MLPRPRQSGLKLSLREAMADGGWRLVLKERAVCTYDGWVTDPPGRRFCGVWRGGLKPGAGGRAFVTRRRRGRELRGRAGGAVIAG